MRVRAATKAELRAEIAELRLIGGQMANVCFNMAQGKTLTAYERDIVDGVRREWDAIKRRESSTAAAALVRRAQGEEPTE